MHYVYRKLKRWVRSALASRWIRLLIGALISVSLCIMPFFAGAANPTYEFVTGLDNGGGNPTLALLNESDVNVYYYRATSTGFVHSNRYTFYELESSENVTLPYLTEIDVDFAGDPVSLPNGGYLQFGYAPRNSYDFIGFGYEFDPSSPNGYKKRDNGISGSVTLSTGEVLPFSDYRQLIEGDTYDYYYFRVELPAGNYRITNFSFNALYQGIGSRLYTFRIGDCYIYKKVPAVPIQDQEIYPGPDDTVIKDYEDVEDALRNEAEDLSPEVNNALEFNLANFLDLHPAFIAIGNMYDAFQGANPVISILIQASVCLGIVGFILNLVGSIIAKARK